MAPNPPKLEIIRAPGVIDELHGIWRWNAENFGVSHADEYLQFLNENIDSIALMYERGKVLERFPDMRHFIFRRRIRGHGHVVVYRFDDIRVRILHIFHTAQDWQNKIADE